MVSRAVNSIRRQLYPRISLIFARFAPIEGFDEYVGDLRDSNHFDEVSVYDVGGRGKRSESMWTGLRAVKTSFFAMLDDDDQWFPDHLHHLMELFESDTSVDFVYSGGIRHDEEGHSPKLHPRLWRNDGTCLDEKRALIFCDAFDIGRLLKWDNVILSHAFIARSELLAAEVLDDPQLDVAEDVYLYLILLARGAKFAFNGRATAVWNWRVRSNDNSMVNYEMARRAEQVERIIRRLGQYRFIGNYLGQDVIGRGIGSIAPVTLKGSPIAHESRSVDIVYDAALEDLISLRKPGRPSCLSSMKGLSLLEDWGRWTEGEIIEFKFRHPLPSSFEFEFVARPASTMRGKTVTIAVGSFSKVITVKNKHLTTYRVPIRHNQWSDTIVMRIANPMSPAEAANDPNGDVRKLGLAMTSFRIIPKRRFMDGPLASVIRPRENKRTISFWPSRSTSDNRSSG